MTIATQTAYSPEEELRDSEARYRRLFESAQDGILILDAQTGRITDVNPFLINLLEYSHEEFLTMAPWDLGRATDMEAAQQAFHELQEKRYIRYENLPLLSRTGHAIRVEVVSNVYMERHRKVIQSNIRDITKRKREEQSEERRLQAQKMEAVGQLAGGLAHDFNNLLGVILGYCEILDDRRDLPEPACKMITEITNAGTSAKNLTQQLLAFSRRQVLQPMPLDLNATVQRMDKMLGRLIGETVKLTYALDQRLGGIKADPNQVEQVLMNLSINARDAMPNGGVVTIETSNIEMDEALAHQFPFIKPGHYVQLTVTDTGVGMDEGTQSHIFEPFFSSKPVGQGTGLGLSTVFGIMRQSGGAISVYSELGAGTVFKLYFPRCDDAAKAVPKTGAPLLLHGTETILLVDDAKPLRQLARQLLELSGYTVIDTGDPSEALRLAAEHKGPLPLMLTDVVMPGFSGPALAERLAAIRPETRVLYMSGYADDSAIQTNVPGQHYAFLEKPFRRDVLLKKVRDILDA